MHRQLLPHARARAQLGVLPQPGGQHRRHGLRTRAPLLRRGQLVSAADPRGDDCRAVPTTLATTEKGVTTI